MLRPIFVQNIESHITEFCDSHLDDFASTSYTSKQKELNDSCKLNMFKLMSDFSNFCLKFSCPIKFYYSVI